MDLNRIYSSFSLDLRLRLLGLLLFNLCAVILIVVDSLSIVRHFVGWSQFCRYLAVEFGKFGFELLQFVPPTLCP